MIDIFVRNDSFRRIDIIDEFESFIWTERFNAMGDFKIVCQPSDKIRKLLLNKNYLTLPDVTDVIMRIEDVFEETKDGKTMIAATGRSLEMLLENRVVSPSWVGNGQAAAAIANLVQIICVDGTGISPNDVITGFMVENLVYVSDPIQKTETKGQSLYNAVKNGLTPAHCGFKIALEYGVYVSNLKFKIYAGTTRNNLIFSTDMDSLINPSYLQSVAKYKNIAYVWHEQGLKIVPRPGTNINVSGIDRRIISVDATDVKPADHVVDEYNAILTQRGLEALYSDEGSMVNLFDGEVPIDTPYVYRRDYFLGDKVYFQGPDNIKQQVRIMEHIISCDSQGMKAYPTFSVVD